MTPGEMARLHAEVFTVPRPWTSAEFTACLADPFGITICESQGFLLGRAVAGEAELLTLAVAPAARRQGIGERLVLRFLEQTRSLAAESVFLEVAQTNIAALALYEKCGFARQGTRKNYYRGSDGQGTDALVLVLRT